VRAKQTGSHAKILRLAEPLAAALAVPPVVEDVIDNQDRLPRQPGGLPMHWPGSGRPPPGGARRMARVQVVAGPKVGRAPFAAAGFQVGPSPWQISSGKDCTPAASAGNRHDSGRCPEFAAAVCADSARLRSICGWGLVRWRSSSWRQGPS